MSKFPQGFFVGAATAAHQVEGNNTHSDYWAQEHMKNSNFAEPSGIACDHYNRYAEDIRLLAEAGCNAYRFSIEWARIEPEEGRFDEAEMQHYIDVIDCCRANGVEPIVTLFHFSSPAWLMGKDGWEAETVPADFAKYTRYVMEHIKDKVHYVCTINEANMRVQVAAVAKHYMLQMMAKMQAAQGGADGKVQVGINLEKMMEGSEEAVKENMAVFGVKTPHVFVSPCTDRGDALVMETHRAARDVIREVAPQVKVGLTLSLHDVQAQPGGEEHAQKQREDELLHYLPAIADDDFLGVQNYTRELTGPEGALPAPAGAELTQMGYEFYPEGIGHVLHYVAEHFKGELMVTENGVATDDDTRRVEYIRRATDGVAEAVADGLPVKGYLYWSLMDNFEWQKGFAMRFGLISVDRSTMARTPKPSLAVLGEMTK